MFRSRQEFDATFLTEGAPPGVHEPVRATHVVNRLDPKGLVKSRPVFCDTAKANRMTVLGIQELNRWLVDVSETGGYFAVRDVENGPEYERFVPDENFAPSEDELQALYIMDRFKLVGVAEAVSSQSKRTNAGSVITTTIEGPANVADHWSSRKFNARVGSHLGFVLKKVMVTNEMRWRSGFGGDVFDRQFAVSPDLVGMMVWQLVPCHSRRRRFEDADRAWNDNGDPLVEPPKRAARGEDEDEDEDEERAARPEFKFGHVIYFGMVIDDMTPPFTRSDDRDSTQSSPLDGAQDVHSVQPRLLKVAIDISEK